MPRLSQNGTPTHRGPGAGPKRCWLNTHTTIEQECGVLGCTLVTDTGGARRIVDPSGANFLAAGGDVWAAHLGGYRDSLGRTHPQWYPLEVGEDGTVVLSPDYGGPAGLAILKPSDTQPTVIVPGQLDTLEQSVDIANGIVLYRQGGKLMRYAPGLPSVSGAAPVLLMDARMSQDGWLVGRLDGFGLVCYQWASPHRGVVLSGDGQDFYPDIQLLVDRVRVVSSVTAGEGPDDVRQWDIVPLDANVLVNGQMRDWVDLTANPSVRLPVLEALRRPAGVGAWFGHDRPFLTTPNTDARFPDIERAGMVRGVFVDLTHGPEWIEAGRIKAASYGWPAWAYTDGYGFRWDRLPADFLPLFYAYLVPEKRSVAACIELLRRDLDAWDRRTDGRPWGLALSLHRGYQGGTTYSRGEQETIDMFAAAYAEGRARGASLFYVFHRGSRTTNPADVFDGVDRFDSFGAMYRALEAAVADPGQFPRWLPPHPRPRPEPGPHPEPQAKEIRSMADETITLKVWNDNPTPETTDGNQDRTPRAMFISCRPGGTEIEYRDAAGSWEWLSVSHPDPGRPHLVALKFITADRVLAVSDAGDIETRPPGTFGKFEAFSDGSLLPDGRRIAFRSADVGSDSAVIFEVSKP